MTRVILTNKKTGQELPEAEMVSKASNAIEIRFDGTTHANAFDLPEWDYREVRTFRNGDVLRRKDRYAAYLRYMYVTKADGTAGRWLEIDPTGSAQLSPHEPGFASRLNDPEWELV